MNTPYPPIPYSPIRKAGTYIFISGQIGIEPKTKELVSNDIELQCKQALINLKTLLQKENLPLSSVFKTTVFLTSMSHYSVMNKVYRTFFTEPFPARSAVAVKELPKGALIEIEAIACKIEA